MRPFNCSEIKIKSGRFRYRLQGLLQPLPLKKNGERKQEIMLETTSGKIRETGRGLQRYMKSTGHRRCNWSIVVSSLRNFPYQAQLVRKKTTPKNRDRQKLQILPVM